MRMSKPSVSSAIMLALCTASAAALGQDSARQEIADHGEQSMERLEDAVARAREATPNGPHPVLPDMDRPAEQHRAFEGLRKRGQPADMEARARAANAIGEAALAAERERQAKVLRQALGLEPSEERALASAVPAVTATGWVPVLFVSSSMPLPVLRSYAAQLERARGVMAFRGMPGGLRKAGPMAKLTAQILRRDPGCEGPACIMRDVQLIVDPIVFRQHGVTTRVPALAMVPGDPAQAYCERDEESPRAAHVVYGDSALPGLLDEYARLGGKEEVRHAQALLGAR